MESRTLEVVVEEAVLPLLTSKETRERKRRKKTTKTHHWTKVCGDNIQQHHREQHAKEWAAYKILLQKKHTEPEKLTLFLRRCTLINYVNSKMQSLISNKQDNLTKTSFLPCLKHLRVRVCAHPTYPIVRFI